MALADPKQEVAAQSRRTAPRRAEHTASGDVAAHVLDLAPGSRVATAGAGVTGEPFYGRLAALAGARVTESPVVYTRGGATASPTGDAAAFIVDFGRSVSVLGLELRDGGAITLVLPWLGTDFALRPVYPAGAEKPNPGAGATVVGFPGVEATKLLVQVTGGGLTAAKFPARCVIETATPPANLRASLNGRLPFWTRPGPLVGEAELTGMAEDLNALVAGAEAPVAVTLALTTDAPGVLKVTPRPAAVDRAAEARWGAQASTDVALEALAPRTAAVPFPSDAAAPWQVTRLTLEVAGAFPPWRAYAAQATTAPGDLSLRVDGAFSVARRLAAAEDAELHGVALLLRTPGAAGELHVELVPDEAGAPAAGDALAAATHALAAGPAAEAWHEVTFPRPVTLPAAGAWLVVQARTGAAEWVAAAEPPGPATRTLGAGHGGRWDRYPPVGGAVAVAQTRLLRRPFAAENAPLLELGWGDGKGAAVQLDPGRDPVLVDLERPAGQPFATTDHSVALVVTAGASGTLTLARATALYREGAT